MSGWYFSGESFPKLLVVKINTNKNYPEEDSRQFCPALCCGLAGYFKVLVCPHYLFQITILIVDVNKIPTLTHEPANM